MVVIVVCVRVVNRIGRFCEVAVIGLTIQWGMTQYICVRVCVCYLRQVMWK